MEKMKYTKSPESLKNYWVKIKKAGSKYYKVIPFSKVPNKIDNTMSKINIKGTEVDVAVGKTKYKVIY